MVGKEKVALNRSWILEKVYWPLRAGRGSTTVSKRAHGTRSRVPAAPKLCREEKGAEMVEFALVVSVLMMIMLGIVSFARTYNVYQSITRAVREGARMAALPTSVYQGNTFTDKNTAGYGSTIFATYVEPALKAADIDPNQCSGSQADCVLSYSEQVNWLNSSGTDENQCGVLLNLKYRYQWISVPFLSPALSTIDLGAHVQMRRENQPVTVGGVTATCGGNPLP